jgi:hypothetical protein
MGKYDWIKLKYDVNPNELICERCGDKQVMPEGSMRFSIFTAIGDAFTKQHKKCSIPTSVTTRRDEK